MLKTLGAANATIIIVPILVIVIVALGVYLLISLRQKGTPKALNYVYPSEPRPTLNHEAVFASLDIGIVVYGADGKRQLTNRAAFELLGHDGIPEQLDQFMTSYCEANGILARLILGKNEASDVLEIGNRVIRLTARESRTQQNRRIATVFILQDITKQELQEQKRKEFVANVSHELKTPLTTIITYSESLVDWGLAEKTAEGVRNDVKRIHDDAIRMQNLVTDLLLLSSIDSRALQMRMESLDLNYLVRQTVDHMQLAAAEKNIQLTCTSVSIVQPVFGDRPSIERIINNLISNAIKYSDVDTEVKVYIGTIHNEAYVKVTDQGYA